MVKFSSAARIISVVFTISLSAAASAAEKFPDGTWKWDSKIGEETRHCVLRMQSEGEKLYGSYDDQFVEARVEDGEVDGRNIWFVLNFVHDNKKVKAEFNGELFERAIRGSIEITVDGEEQGEFEWKATRQVGQVPDVYSYKKVESRELKMLVTLPPNWKPSDSPRPAIVFFHGGGWTGGKPGQFTEHAKYFASRGLVCFQVEYRLLDKSGKEPPVTCTEDAVSAMRWVRTHSSKFGIDPNRIASGGGSAGGHLAAYVGCIDLPNEENVTSSIAYKSNAMLLFNPVYDNGPGGWGTARVGDRYGEFSPLHNISKDDPPSIVFLGTEDALVPVATAETFRDKTAGFGIESELHTYEGQPHGFFNYTKSEGLYFYKTVVAADKFLAKLGWISGAPTLKNSSQNGVIKE